MENNLSAKANSVKSRSTLKAVLFSVIAGALLFAIHLPFYFFPVPAICYVAACIFMSVAISYKGNFKLLIAALPCIVCSALFGNIILIVYPIFACLIAISATYSVRYFKEKKYTVIAVAAVFFIILITVASLSMIDAYGSLSSSAFKSLNDNTKKIWLDFVNENSAIISAAFGDNFVSMGEEIYNAYLTLLLYFSVGLVIGTCVAIGYVFTFVYYIFIKEKNGCLYSVKLENSGLNISAFGASLYLISVFISTFTIWGIISLKILLVFANLSLIYFPLFFVCGLKYIIARLHTRNLPTFFIIFLCVTFFVTPLYPIIILSLFGASNTITLSLQRKIIENSKSNNNDSDRKND